MYDAIIVGARCAGSTTGMLLARAGYRSLVVDRANFPSDVLSTHFLQPDAVMRLKEWGLLDRVMASGCPAHHGVKFVIDGVEFPGPPSDEVPIIAPRRTVLDAILVDAARAAGAEVRENFSVQELLTEDGAVVGIRGQVSGGEPILERARIVIGADGRNSLVARSVAAESYNTIPPRQVGYYSYWSGFDNQNWSELHAENGQVRAFIFPTNDGLCCIGALTKYSEFETVRKDPAAFMRGTFLDIKSLAGRCENLKQEGRTMGWSGYESYYKKPFGPGWALVGDAGYLKDPTLGQGINDAFRDAEYLAGGLDAGFSGREELTAALAAYQQRRDAESGPVYAMNDLFASGQVSPMLMEMLIAGQQMLKAAG